MNKYCADFETIYRNDKRVVWLWAVCRIPFNDETFIYDNSIESFIDYVSKNPGRYYFHNLKYDASYLLNFILNNGFKWVNKIKPDNNEFTTLITNTCTYYSIKININNNVTEFYDSLKIINMSVEKIAKTFKLPILKGEIDYNKPREENYMPDKIEIEYIKHDIAIVSFALNYFFSQGLTKMTQGSDALQEFKKMIGHKNYNMMFPKIDINIDKDIRKAYKGGYVYLNPKYKNKIIKKDGYVIDYNSLYPSVMYSKKFPYSQPIFFEGQYIFDKNYPLYIQHIKCQFELKKGFLPTLQIKNNPSYVMNEYLTNSGLECPDIFLTNVDLCLFFEHYNVYNLEFINGWKFRAKSNIFKDYIEKWSEIKVNSKIEGNTGMTQIAKLMLNSLYGKFGTNPISKTKQPYLENDTIKYLNNPEDTKDGGYIPMACFITAYARNETIRAAQKIYETGNYIYSDTDSIHALGDIPDFIALDDAKFMHWKKELNIKYCKYLRQKCYVDYGIEPGKNKLIRKITVASMPKECKSMFTIKKFELGQSYGNRLKSKQVKGGIDLVGQPFVLLK